MKNKKHDWKKQVDYINNHLFLSGHRFKKSTAYDIELLEAKRFNALQIRQKLSDGPWNEVYEEARALGCFWGSYNRKWYVFTCSENNESIDPNTTLKFKRERGETCGMSHNYIPRGSDINTVQWLRRKSYKELPLLIGDKSLTKEAHVMIELILKGEADLIERRDDLVKRYFLTEIKSRHARKVLSYCNLLMQGYLHSWVEKYAPPSEMDVYLRTVRKFKFIINGREYICECEIGEVKFWATPEEPLSHIDIKHKPLIEKGKKAA